MNSKRFLSVLVAAAMIAGTMPTSVFAGRLDYEPEETEPAQITETEEEKPSKPAEKETEPTEKETEETKATEASEPSEKEPEAAEETEASKPDETGTEESKETEPAETSEPEASETEKETEPAEPEAEEPSESEGKAEIAVPGDSVKKRNAADYYGAINKNLNWSLDYSTGVFTISGTGNMPHYDYEHLPPWDFYKDGIQKVVIEEGVTSIGGESFKDCKNLKSVKFADSLTYIGASSFMFCNSLSGDLTIPANVTQIGGSAFQDCSFKTVTILGSVDAINAFTFCGCTELESITIPSGPKIIDGWAFDGCKKLERFTIPDSVTDIQIAAFGMCTALKEITIPGNVKHIGIEAFAGCTALEKLTIEYGVRELDRCSFQECKNLKTVSIPNSVTTIEGGAFNECDNIEDLTISEYLYNNGLGNTSLDAKPGGVHFLQLADNPMTLKGKNAKVRYKKLRKKARTVKAAKVIAFTKKPQGTIEYKKSYGNKKITVNKNNGTITLKKKMKRGTYIVKVKVRALGTETVKQTGWKTVKFKIKVR